MPLETHANSLGDGWSLSDFQSGGLRDLGSELRAEFRHVVGEERRLVAGAGDRDVAEAGVEQVRADAGIGVNEKAFGGEPLGAMTADGIASRSRKRTTNLPPTIPAVSQRSACTGKSNASYR